MNQANQIRWMIRSDMDRVLEIENAAFGNPWSEDDFIRVLRQRNAIGMVADRDDKVLGFMLYELHKNRLQVVNFAVAKEWQRRGVGTEMIGKLQSKLSHMRRSKITIEVRETNLAVQFFLKQMGFKAVSVLRDHWEDSDEDAYVMQYRHKPIDAELAPFQITNRLPK
jgi:ribosomal-protein-alanine N-acetyltransferase